MRKGPTRARMSANPVPKLCSAGSNNNKASSNDKAYSITNRDPGSRWSGWGATGCCQWGQGRGWRPDLQR